MYIKFFRYDKLLWIYFHGFKGNKYTWINKRYKHRNVLILKKLDRFLATDDWLFRYPNAHVLHPPCTHSDHCPLLLFIYKDDPTLRKWFFKFERIEASYPDFENVIARIWDNSCSLEHVVTMFERAAIVRAHRNVGNIFKNKE